MFLLASFFPPSDLDFPQRRRSILFLFFLFRSGILGISLALEGGGGGGGRRRNDKSFTRRRRRKIGNGGGGGGGGGGGKRIVVGKGLRSTTLFLVFKTFYTKKQSASNNFLRIILTVEFQTLVKYDLVLCVQCSKAAQMRPRGLRTESIRCF